MLIGENVTKIRESKGMTRTALAKKSGVVYRTLENIEKGKTPNPTILIVGKIARALGVSIDMLLWEKEKVLPIAVPSEIVEILNKKTTAYFLNLLKEVNIEDLQKLLDFMISLSQHKKTNDTGT